MHPDAGWSSLVARRAHNPKVVGSNPAPATTFRLNAIAVNHATLAQLVERNLAKVEVTSSNLVCRSKFSLRAQWFLSKKRLVYSLIVLNNASGRGMEQLGSSSGS